MRVAAFTTDDSTDLEILDRSDPTPASGQAVVRVEAAALNHRDLWTIRDDRLERDDLPFVPGGDLAGTVVETGPDVSRVGDGDRVVLCPLESCGTCRFCREGPENMCEAYSSYDGAFAERALVDASRLVRLPDSVDVADAAALPIAYTTAYRMLKRGETAAGDRVFVPGATGGVGIAAVQLASLLGAETVGTSRSATKLERVAAAGLDHAIHSSDPDEIRDAVEEIGDVDVTINHLGGPYTRLGADVLRTNGAMVVCGRTAGRYPEIDARDLYFGHKRILGSTLGTQPDLERLVSFAADGRLEPVLADEYPIAEATRAVRAMDEREHVGKLLIRPQA
ncbi:alcohol dehydrogenase catalytic domain-containing protein [Natronolimnohabitans innermongolicus]|uniref:NADPH:quinone reductase n=1 Tax=Natronolimnohabitans innermongolicus JCM 12255 TaxID=1227499 RepID=L9X2B6_9EURY|nr:alcohol dehydrogenase catalytic domain-containing protein [Natronolimnohabitans innermongolicus]ELY55904.1 NADPH:quinone reductase [Natronolimnohabitans innermongolicus JCM 12255]